MLGVCINAFQISPCCHSPGGISRGSYIRGDAQRVAIREPQFQT
jgi:hypothetical protein